MADYEKDVGMSKDFPATANVLSRGGKYTGQVDEGVAPGEDLHRKLKARQITMVRAATSLLSCRNDVADSLLS